MRIIQSSFLPFCCLRDSTVTLVVQSAERRTSDLDVTASRPPAAASHIRYVLLINSPNNLNLLSWLLIYLRYK